MSSIFIRRSSPGLLAALAVCVPFAVSAAEPVMAPAGLSYREKLMLIALVLAASAMLAALVSLVLTRRRYKRRLAEHTLELRKAFANAYVGMKDSAVDVERVRDAERILGRIIADLEHFI